MSRALTGRAVVSLAKGAYLGKSAEAINGTGYCVASLEAALWCFHRTTSFEDAVLEAIPRFWREKLHNVTEIDGLARALHEQATRLP